jgi:uncharacterized protein YkwD
LRYIYLSRPKKYRIELNNLSTDRLVSLAVKKIWIYPIAVGLLAIAAACKLPYLDNFPIPQRSPEPTASSPVPKPSTTTKPTTATPTSAFSKIEREIITEMNLARSNPAGYRQVMLAWRSKFDGKRARLSDRVYLQTQEGTPAIDEAIQFLAKTRPVGKLTYSKGLSLAARDHVRDQGAKGATGHNSSNGNTPFQRMERYGKWQQIAGENIAYGPDTARAVVRDLIIDDGVPDRGHRTNMFKPEFRVTGVACGYHRQYRVMCDIKYAGGFRDR